MKIVSGDNKALNNLIHYSSSSLLLSKIYSTLQICPGDKPYGLWVSDDNAVQDWLSWVKGENFNVNKYIVKNKITINKQAKILLLSDFDDLVHFTANFKFENPNSWTGIKWQKVEKIYDGILITPYIWKGRFNNKTPWYYGWDCASRCIWNHKAIKDVQSEN